MSRTASKYFKNAASRQSSGILKKCSRISRTPKARSARSEIRVGPPPVELADERLEPQAVPGTVVGLVGDVRVGPRVILEDVLDGYLAAAARPGLDAEGVAGHAVDVVGPEGLHLGLAPLGRYYAVSTALEGLEGLVRAPGGQVARQAPCWFVNYIFKISK